MILIPSLSYAQIEDYNFEYAIEKDKFYMFVQIQIRDASGNLAGYIETDRITILNPDEFLKVLDKTPNDPTLKRNITIDNQDYEVITGVGNVMHELDTVVSLSAISSGGIVVAYANHDGYPVRNGDLAVSTWTIIRPA